MPPRLKFKTRTARGRIARYIRRTARARTARTRSSSLALGPSYASYARVPGYRINPLINMKGKNPFPQTYYCKMIYSHNGKIQTDGTIGGVAHPEVFGTPFVGGIKLNDYSFLHANSVPGCTQMEQIYQYCLIYGVKVLARFNNNTQQGTGIGFQVATGSTLSTMSIQGRTVDYALEREDSTFQPIQDDSRIKPFKKYIPINRVFAISKNMLRTEDRYRSIVNPVTSPADTCSLLICACSPGRLSAGQYVDTTVEVVYYCKFFADFQF